MTCRLVQGFVQNISGLRHIAPAICVAIFLVTGVTYAQQVQQYQATPVQSNSQLRWGNPGVSTGQPVSQNMPSQTIRPAIPSTSQVVQVQYSEPVLAPTLPQAQQNGVRVAQGPGAGQNNAIFDTTHPEMSRSGSRSSNTPNPTLPSSGSGISTNLGGDTDVTDVPSSLNVTSGLSRRTQTSYECRSPLDPKLFTPMSDITYEIGVPIDMALLNMCPINVGEFQERNWSCICFQYTASGVCHKAAYFEDIALERYGHSWGPFMQPVVSAGKFYLSVLFLPYKMGVTPPQECVYSIGYYRPGSCAPYMIDPLPLSVRAGLMQAGAVVGLAYVIP